MIEDHHAQLLNLRVNGHVPRNRNAISQGTIVLFLGQVEVLFRGSLGAPKHVIAIERKLHAEAAVKPVAATLEQYIRRIDVNVQMERRVA